LRLCGEITCNDRQEAGSILFLFDLGKRMHYYEERRWLRTGKCNQERG
jgi:hypothetical protein